MGDFPPVLYGEIAFGDTDHDEKTEGAAYINDNLTFQYRILEHQGKNNYTLEYAGAPLLPYAMGDFDADGKADILGQNGFFLKIYESADATSYPSQLVWTSPSMSNTIGLAAVADTDRDGRMEIIHSINGGNYLVIFENSADNTYDLVYSLYTGTREHGAKAFADFDGDGLIEIAFGTIAGIFHVLESPADNQWVETWHEDTLFDNMTAMKTWPDADGNGRPEIYATGSLGLSRTTVIFEAVADNTFESVAKLSRPTPGSGFGINAVGNLDGIGPPELVMKAGAELVIYQVAGIGEWVEAGTLMNPMGDTIGEGIQTFDANGNGRAELFWDRPGAIDSGSRSWIYEHDAVPVDTSMQPRRWRTLTISPNPARVHAAIMIDAPTAPQALLVFDVAGRLVDRVLTPGTSRVTWSPGSAGAYFLKLQDSQGGTLGQGRVIVTPPRSFPAAEMSFTDIPERPLLRR